MYGILVDTITHLREAKMIENKRKAKILSYAFNLMNHLILNIEIPRDKDNLDAFYIVLKN